MSVSENRAVLTDAAGRTRVVAERTHEPIKLFFADGQGGYHDAAALTTLTLTLYERDAAALTIINAVDGVNILNDGTRGTVPTKKTVTGATNASPIVLTVASHGYSTGDRVAVWGVLGNKGANGVRTITVLDANTFELDGSAGTGAYTSGGSVVKEVQILLQPADNQIVTAANEMEWHRALLQWTWSAGARAEKYEIDFPVRNLNKVS